MSDYLPPVVVELEGRDAQLIRTLESAKTEVRRWAADVGRMKADVTVRLNLASGDVQRIQRQVGQIRSTVSVGLRVNNTAAVTLQRRLDEITRDRNVNTDFGVRLAIAPGEVRKIQEQVGRIRATLRLGLRLDEPALTAAHARLDELTADRTVTIRTRTIGGGAGGSGGGAGRNGGRLLSWLPLAAAAVPVAAAVTAATLQLSVATTAATVSAGVFGLALGSQMSQMGEAADAQKKYEDAVEEYGATSQQAAKAQLEATKALEELPPATRRATVAWSLLKDEYKAWSDQTAQFTVEPVTQGIGILEALLPKLTPMVEGTSGEFERLTTLVGGGISTPGFDELMDKVEHFATSSLAKGIDYAVHFTRVLSEGDVTDGALGQFMAYSKENGPLVAETLRNLADAAANVLEGAADAGPGLLALASSAAELVAALPPEVISTLIQLAAALKLISLTRAGVLAVGGSVGGLSTRLGDLRTQSSGAGSGLARLRAGIGALSTATKATIVLAALAALGVAVAKIAELGSDAPPDIDKLTTSLGRLGESGTAEGEAYKQFGADLDGLRDSMKSFVDPSVMDNIQQGIIKVVTLGTTDSTPVKEAKEQVEAIDQALANLVQNGNADVAASALEKLKAAYGEGGHDVDKFTGQLTEYEKAVDDAAFAAELAAASQGLFGKQAQDVQKKLDEQKASADGLRQSLQALNDVNRAALGGQIGFEQAIDAATKAAKDNANALDVKDGKLQLGTEKARDAATALSDLAVKTDEAAAAARENGANWETVNGIYDQGRDKLVEVAQKMGLTKDEAKSLASEILNIPDKQLRVEMQDEDAKNDLNAFIKKVNDSPGKKSVTLTTLTKEGEKILEKFGYKVTHLKDGKVKVEAKTGTAVDNIGKVQKARDKLSDKEITITTRKVTVISTIVQDSASSQADALNKQAERFGGGKAHGGPVRRATGGPVQYFGGGGYIDGPGTAMSDSILALFASGATARVSDSEYVVQASAVRKYGIGVLDALNAGQLRLAGFASGGSTEAAKSARSSLTSQVRTSAAGRLAGYTTSPLTQDLTSAGSVDALASSLESLRLTIAEGFSGIPEIVLTRVWQSTSTKLLGLQKSLGTVTGALEEARDKLSDLKNSASQLRSQIASGILSGRGVVTQAPQQGLPLTAADVLNNMAGNLSQVQAFETQLETLKGRGLSAELLKQIASAGIDQGGATAAALVGASDADLKTLNSIQTQMNASAQRTGILVSDSMYGAGISAVQGLVDGLESKQALIEAQMLKIAKSMQEAIREVLDINSPSKVMAELGDYTALGYAVGIDRSSVKAVTAAEAMALAVQQSATLTALPALTTTLPALQPVAGAVVHHHYEPQFTVEGHVLSERNLRDVVQEQMLRLGSRNSQTWQPYQR